jgi:hypothetical protein
MAFPIEVAAGESVTVRALPTSGRNAVLSGLFLGEEGRPDVGWEREPQGDWVGVFGGDGYALGGWHGSSDEVVLPGARLVVERAARFTYASSTGQRRALADPSDPSLRRASSWWDRSEVRLRLDFDEDYSGVLRVYALDGHADGRLQDVRVEGGGESRTVRITDPFIEGAWMAFPIEVAAGESVTVRALPTSGRNAVLSGLFLGEEAR